MNRKRLAGLACPACAILLTAEAPQVDNVGICPACDATLELSGGTLRVIPERELLSFEQQLQRVVRGSAGRVARPRMLRQVPARVLKRQRRESS